jgi:hypothetical protein
MFEQTCVKGNMILYFAVTLSTKMSKREGMSGSNKIDFTLAEGAHVFGSALRSEQAASSRRLSDFFAL